MAETRGIIGDSEADVSVPIDSRAQLRRKVHSPNPLERLNMEVKRRTDVIGIFPNEGATIRLIGAVLLEASRESQLQHRCMKTETTAELIPSRVDAPAPEIATVDA